MELKNTFPSLFVAVIVTFLCACNRDNTLIAPTVAPLAVTFDNGTGVYEVKINRSVSVTPTVENAVDPRCLWVDDRGVTVAEGPTLTFSSAVPGEFYFTFIVKATNGTASEDLRIDVMEKILPTVSLPSALETVIGVPLTINPAVTDGGDPDADYRWTYDGEPVGKSSVLTLTPERTGVFALGLTVTNEDGSASATTEITVNPRPALAVTFGRNSVDVFSDRSVSLVPQVENAEGEVSYSWSVDGTVLEGVTGNSFEFTPARSGISVVTVRVADRDSEAVASIDVNCLGVSESDRFRPAGSASSASEVTVYEFMPAPGQFVGQIASTTMANACREAAATVNRGELLSLGSFGGYIVVGFDHSVSAGVSGYDFAIAGNSFDTNSEPGIVYVMQDENGNGLPDDSWYELRASETDSPETVRNYTVTYYRPAASGSPVVWVDRFNSTGTISLNPYYPAWQTADSYILGGSLLKARTEFTGTIWANRPFGWGYADNFGSDRLTDDANASAGANYNYFKISNAMRADGSPAELKFIDFIMVRSSVLTTAGYLGEVSTEIAGFLDCNM